MTPAELPLPEFLQWVRATAETGPDLSLTREERFAAYARRDELIRAVGDTLVYGKVMPPFESLRGEIEAMLKVGPEYRVDHFGAHLSHCNFGEESGQCKYGDANCPALTEDWRWFGAALDRQSKVDELADLLWQLREVTRQIERANEIHKVGARP